MAQHSNFNKVPSKTACGLPILPIRAKTQGMIPITKQADIIDEGFALFRANVLFKNFSIEGNADKLLSLLQINLKLVIHLLCRKLQAGAKKRLGEIVSGHVPKPKDKGYFLSAVLDEPKAGELEVYSSFMKQFKEEIVLRFLEKFYVDGMQIDDFRFWAGLAKKKFMGYTFSSGF